MKRGARVIIDRLDVKEIVHERAISSIKDTLDYLIKEKGLLLQEGVLEMVYDLTNRYAEQITDYVIANDRTETLTGTGTETARSFFHSTWQI